MHKLMMVLVATYEGKSAFIRCNSFGMSRAVRKRMVEWAKCFIVHNEHFRSFCQSWKIVETQCLGPSIIGIVHYQANWGRGYILCTRQRTRTYSVIPSLTGWPAFSISTPAESPSLMCRRTRKMKIIRMRTRGLLVEFNFSRDWVQLESWATQLTPFKHVRYTPTSIFHHIMLLSFYACPVVCYFVTSHPSLGAHTTTSFDWMDFPVVLRFMLFIQHSRYIEYSRGWKTLVMACFCG